mgnify:CR=1 FL=1
MTISMLEKRARYLADELSKVKQEVINLNERLQIANTNFATISGHVNEVAYQLEESKKGVIEESNVIEHVGDNNG